MRTSAKPDKSRAVRQRRPPTVTYSHFGVYAADGFRGRLWRVASDLGLREKRRVTYKEIAGTIAEYTSRQLQPSTVLRWFNGTTTSPEPWAVVAVTRYFTEKLKVLVDPGWLLFGDATKGTAVSGSRYSWRLNRRDVAVVDQALREHLCAFKDCFGESRLNR